MDRARLRSLANAPVSRRAPPPHQPLPPPASLPRSGSPVLAPRRTDLPLATAGARPMTPTNAPRTPSPSKHISPPSYRQTLPFAFSSISRTYETRNAANPAILPISFHLPSLSGQSYRQFLPFAFRLFSTTYNSANSRPERLSAPRAAPPRAGEGAFRAPSRPREHRKRTAHERAFPALAILAPRVGIPARGDRAPGTRQHDPLRRMPLAPLDRRGLRQVRHLQRRPGPGRPVRFRGPSMTGLRIPVQHRAHPDLAGRA